MWSAFGYASHLHERNFLTQQDLKETTAIFEINACFESTHMYYYDLQFFPLNERF